MLCPSCQAENRDGAKFCDECGARLDSATLNAVQDPAPSSSVSEQESSSENAPDATSVLPTADATTVLPADGVQATEVIPTSEAVHDADVTRRLDDLPGYDKMADDYTSGTHWHSGGTMQMPPLKGIKEAPESRDFRAPEEKKPKGKKIAIIVLVVVLVLAGIGFGTYQMELWGGKRVPDVTGMALADATYLLEGQGFQVRVEKVKSDDTEGIVLMTDPSAGGRAPEGAEIVVHVAVGRSMPDIVGMQIDEAKKKIQDEGLTNVTFIDKPSDEKEGKVLEATPEKGTKLKSGTPVTVTVAVPFTVPDVVGKDQYAAIQLVNDAGLEAYVVPVYTDSEADGTVLSTDPEAGTKVKGGTPVTLSVARWRAAALEEATRSILSNGARVSIGGVNYIVNSLDSCSYNGDDSVSYTITAQPYAVVLGEVVSLSARSVSGTISFDDANNVKGGNPDFSVL